MLRHGKQRPSREHSPGPRSLPLDARRAPPLCGPCAGCGRGSRLTPSNMYTFRSLMLSVALASLCALLVLMFHP